MGQTTEETDRYRWVILCVLWIAFIVVYLNRLSVGPLGPFLKEELDLTSAQVGMVMSAAVFGYMFTQLPSGWVVDKIGARWPIAAGELIAGVSMIALYFVPSYLWLLMLMFVTGLGCGFLMPATTQGVIVWFPQRERATVMGLKQTAVNIGGIISAATLPIVALSLGWRYGFLFLGMTAIAISLLSLIFYKEPLGPNSSRSAGLSGLTTAVPLREILGNREIWLVAFSGGCFSWVDMATMAHLVLYLTEVILVPVVTAGGLLAVAQAAGAVAKPGSGLLSDWVFRGHRKPVFMMMAGISCAMCLLVGLIGSHLSWALYPVLFMLGLAATGFGGVFIALISELGGRQGAGKATGLAITVTMGGSMFGPIVFGHIVDVSASYELAWLSLAFMSAFCVLLLLFVREGRKRI